MAFNITAIMNVALASGAATKISRDINKALQNKRVTVDLSLANPDSIKRIRADIEGAITSVESFGRQAGLAAKRFGAFSLAAGSMITLVSAIKSSTGEAISFDREMVRLGQVSNDSVASIQAVGNEVTRLSVALGVSSKDLIGAAVTLKQANLSIDDTKIALEALAKAALAPNFENFANTTQGAIAVLNQFKIGAAGLEAALGSVNAVAGEYAVEASDLVEVIRKTGGAFKSAGGDLNELLALFTSVRQTTRESAETISTGLRTIFTRIQRGQTIESLKELGINLRYTSQEAAALGNIKLADQFVGPYEAVRRLSEALAGIPTTSGKYSAIVEELGGYRQISKVIPLLQEFSVSQGALNVALGGSSSLAANAAQAQNAYIIKIQKIKEEFNALIRSVTQSSGFQKIFDTFISGASAAIQLADALKFLLPLITAIAAVKLATSFGQFVKGFATGVTASPNPKIFNQNRVAEGGYIKMAKGGVVPGSGSGDKVKALLEPGELVIPKKYVGGGTVPVNDMSSLAIQRRLNDPNIPDSNYKEGKTLNKSDKFKYEIVNIKIDGGPDSIKPGDYKYEGEYFENIAALKLNAQRLSKDNATAPVDLEKNGFPYEVKNVSTPVSDADIVDKLARYRLEKFGDNIFKNSSKGDETVDLGQIGLVYNTAKMDINKAAFKNTETITDGQENYRRKTYATQTSEGISNVTLSTKEAKNRLATKKASGGFMIPGTGNTDSFPMDLDEGSFVVRKSSVAKLGAENLHSMSRKGYAKGGKVPALLMPGEFVFSPSSAKSIGSANLERMNKHAKFAAGGRVGLAAGGNPNPIDEEAYTVGSQTQIKIPNLKSLDQFAKAFPDLTEATSALREIMLAEISAFRTDLSERQKLTVATSMAEGVMKKYEILAKAIKDQEDVIRSGGSAGSTVQEDLDKLDALRAKMRSFSDKVGISNVVLPTGDVQSRTIMASNVPVKVGKGSEYEYKDGQNINIANEIRNRADKRAEVIDPNKLGDNIGNATKIRLAAEEEAKLRKQLILAIGEQLRITTGITDQEVLTEMAVEKFTLAMQQNAQLAKDSQGRLLGLVSLEKDIVDSGKDVDQSMRGVSQELKVGSTAIGKLKLVFRNAEDIINRSFAEFGQEVRKGGGGISGFFSGVKNSKLGRIVAGSGAAIAGIGGQYLASTAGTAEDVSRGVVSAGRYVASTGIGEALNQGTTAAVALSMIPVAGPYLAVIGGATAALVGLVTAVNKARIELLKVQVDKMAKGTSEKISELKNFSGVEREQKSEAAFADIRSTVFAIRQTATAEGLSGAKLEDEVRAKSLEKFGSNLGAISEELSNAIANMVKPDDKRKSEDIYNEFKQTSYGQLAIESLGVASGKSTAEVQKHALALASSAITAKKLEDAQKNSIIIHEKMNLKMSVLTNSINLASESFRNISESMVNFSDILEGRSEFKIQQNTSRLKIGTDKGLFDKEIDRAFLPFGDEGNNLKNQAKELNAFALNLPAAFDAAKLNVGVGDVGLATEEILKKQLGMKPGDKFTSTQQELIDLFKGQIINEQKNKPDLGGISGEKITKDALGQAISQMEQLLQSNMRAVSEVSQSYISGLRRISNEQKKYIQELDKVAEKTLSVNKAQANIDAAKVRGNPEDFLTREQRIAPFVQKQINVTQGAVNRGAIQAKDIQDPQAIFKAITDAQAALIDSDKKLQEENAKLASANKGDAESARKAALENNNLRDNISTLGEALRNLRDDTVMLAEAESRLTQAEKDRENKLSVTENLLTMDRAGKRNLRRGKEAAEQVAGGANLEDMSLKQRKAFFEYTKLYANIKVPGLGGKTGEQVRQAGLERAAGGFELGVGKENEAANKAREDILKIEKTREEAAQKYADLLKGNEADNVKALASVGDKFIQDLQNMLALENDRNLQGQINLQDVRMDKLTQIRDDKNYQQYTNIIGQGPNKYNREKQFSTVFSESNLRSIANENKESAKIEKTIANYKKRTDIDLTPKIIEQEELLKQSKTRASKLRGIFTEEDVKDYLPSAVGSPLPAGKFAPQTSDLLLIAERMRGVGTSIDKLPKAIDDLALVIKDMKGRLKNPPPDNKANGGFIGRSMGGSIYNNPTKDIAQRDKYPTLLSKGEFVMNEGAARNNRSELELMNKGHKVGYFDVGGRLTQADIDKSRRETLEERARIVNNKASITGSSVGVNPITKEDIDLMMRPSSPKSIQDKKDLLLENIKKMEESKEYKEKKLKVKEKYNLTDLNMPEGFQFEGYEKHLNKIRPDRRKGIEGRPEVDDINDVKYTIADIRLEFERAVSDLAYVNAEGRKLSKNENIAEDIVGKLTYSKDTWKDISNPAASLKQITENANKFDYEDEFFHHLKDITPRYPFSYGNEIDPSISNDIKGMGVYGLRDTWRKVGGSYGSAPNIISSTKNQGFEVSSAGQVELGGLSEEGANHLINNLKINELRHRAGMGGFKLPSIDPLTGKEISGETNTNQQESDILIDLIQKVRDQKKQALAQNIENIKKKVNAQIKAESSLEKGIPLKGMDAKLAKTNENLYARIKNPRLPDDKLPFPVQGFKGEFTPEAEAAPITRPTIAMQEAQAIKNVEMEKQTALNRKKRLDEAEKLKENLFLEAIRHTNPKDLEGKDLTYENVKAFGGKENDIKKMMAFKKSQIQSGDTDSLAQRLHTQIAKTIASYKKPEMDFNDPLVYMDFLKQVNISKLGDVKKLSSVSLKSYADENIPVLNPAIMALQEYYDSVNERRFGFKNTEDFARTIQNKDIELAAKMDREAAMLIARKARKEIKVEDSSSEVSPIGDAPKQNIVSLLNTYNQYQKSLAKQSKSFKIDDITYDDKNKINFDSISNNIPIDQKEINQKYNEIYLETTAIAKDLVNVYNKKDNLSYARPYYEKTKIAQSKLEKLIENETNSNFKNMAVQDFLERRKKEKPAEAAKVIAEEKAKPVVAAPAEKAKPLVKDPPMLGAGDRQNAPEDQIAKQDDAKRTMLLDYVSLVQDNPHYWERTKDEESANKKYRDMFSHFHEGTPDSFKYYIARQPNQKGKKPEMDDMIKSIDRSSRNLKALSRLGLGGVFSASGDLTFDFLKSNIESRKEKIKKEEEIVRYMGGEKDDVFFEEFARNTLSVAHNLTKVPVVPFFNTGGPVAYRSNGGGVDAMLTPGEWVASPEIAAKNAPLLHHINSGGDVKNFNFGGRVSGGRSFRVPAYAPNPNPQRFKKSGTDTVAAPALAAGSFVVNAKDTAKNISVLQNLASGGSVGYYQVGGKLDKGDFDLLGDPTEKNTKYTEGLTKLLNKIYKSPPSVYENPLKQKFNLTTREQLENKLVKIATAAHNQNQGVIKDKYGMPVFSDERMLYNEIVNGISPSNFSKFLNSGRMEKSQAEYERLLNIQADKELGNISALNDELNSPFKRRSIGQKKQIQKIENLLPSPVDSNFTGDSKKGPTEEQLKNIEEQRRKMFLLSPEGRREKLDQITQNQNINARGVELENLRKRLRESEYGPFNNQKEYMRMLEEIDAKEKQYKELIEKNKLDKNNFNLLPAAGFANGGEIDPDKIQKLKTSLDPERMQKVQKALKKRKYQDPNEMQKLQTALPKMQDPNEMQKLQTALPKMQDPNEMQKLQTALPEMMTKKLSAVTDFQKRTETFSPEILKMFEAPEELQKVKSVAPKGYADGGVVQYYQNAGMVKPAKTEAEKYRDRIRRESEIRQAQINKIEERRRNVGGEGVIGGIRPNEEKILKGSGRAGLVNQPLASLSMQELKDKIDKYTNPESELDYLDADELQRTRQEFANRIKKIQFNERYTQLNNALNSQKRGGKKDNTEAAEKFEDFLRNNNIKGKAYDGLPNALKGKNIDKSYLTGIAHFAPNILKNLNDEKIKNMVINLIKQRKIKGFSGDSGKFEEANYFGELGDRFNNKDVFLKMSDITPVIDLLNRVDKGRETNLNSTAKGQRIKSKNPLNAKKFMEEYGAKDEDGNPIHTALTARVEYFNPDVKEDGFFDLKPKKDENPKLREHTIEDTINRPRRFDQGGYVNGALDGDTIPAYLSAGEFVMPRHAVNRIGLGNLEKMRKPQRFYDGGAVGSSGASVFDKMNNVANSQSANSMDVDSLNNAAREFNKAAKSFETSMAKMEKSVNKLEGTMDKLSKVNIPDNITGNITVNNQATVTIDSPNFANDITTAVGKAVSDITGRLNDVSEGRLDIRDIRNA